MYIYVFTIKYHFPFYLPSFYFLCLSICHRVMYSKREMVCISYFFLPINLPLSKRLCKCFQRKHLLYLGVLALLIVIQVCQNVSIDLKSHKRSFKIRIIFGYFDTRALISYINLILSCIVISMSIRCCVMTIMECTPFICTLNIHKT